MKRTLVNLLKFSIFLGVGLGILYLVYRSQDTAYQAQCALDGIPADECSLSNKIITDFQTANYWWIGLVLVLFTLSNVSRALRWNMLLRPLGYEPRTVNTFGATMLTYFANLGLPRLGEVVRVATVSRYERIPAEQVAGTVVVDRVADVICLASVIGFAFLIEFDTLVEFITSSNEGTTAAGSRSWLVILLASAGGAFLLSVVMFFVFKDTVEQWGLYKRVKKVLMGFWEGIKSIREVDRPVIFLLHSIFIWSMYFLMTYVCFFAFEPTAGLGATAALMVFVFGSLGIVVPSPGGMGTYHALVIAALSVYGIGKADAFSFANIIFFSINIFCNILLGLVALVSLPLLNREPRINMDYTDGTD